MWIDERGFEYFSTSSTRERTHTLIIDKVCYKFKREEIQEEFKWWIVFKGNDASFFTKLAFSKDVFNHWHLLKPTGSSNIR